MRAWFLVFAACAEGGPTDLPVVDGRVVADVAGNPEHLFRVTERPVLPSPFPVHWDRARVVLEADDRPRPTAVIAAHRDASAHAVITWIGAVDGALAVTDHERVGVMRWKVTSWHVPVTASWIPLRLTADEPLRLSEAPTAAVALLVSGGVDAQQLASAIATLDLAGAPMIGLALADP